MHSPVTTAGNGSPSILRFPGTEAHHANPITLGHLAAHYLNVKATELRAEHIGQTTYDHLHFLVTRFREDYGDLPVEDAPPRLLTEWLLRHPEWRSWARKHDAVAAAMAVMRLALDDELIDRNPLRRPRHLGPPMAPRPELTKAEYVAIKKAAKAVRTKRGRSRTRGYFRAGLLFLWRTGARTCEMRSVRWDQVNWVEMVIRLDTHKTFGKTGRPRLIPIGHCLPLLRFLLRHRRPGQETVFANSLGKPLTKDRFVKEFRRYARAAGVSEAKSAYCCRHAVCCRKIEEGHSDRAISDLLGHSSTRMVNWYGRAARSKASHLNNVARKRK